MSCIALNEKQALQWDSDELASWLSSRGLPDDITEPFKRQSVCGLRAVNFHEGDLVKLGIWHPIRRRRVIRELQQLFHGYSFASTSVSDVSPADESPTLPDAGDATHAQAGKIPGWQQASVEWSVSAGPEFTGQDADAFEVDPEESLEHVEDEPADPAEAYNAMTQMSASKASLSRKCTKLRQELIEERRKRSIATSDYERRVREAERDRNSMKYSLRNAVLRSKSKERESQLLQARLRWLVKGPDKEEPLAKPKAKPTHAFWGWDAETGEKEKPVTKTKAESAEVSFQECSPGRDGKEAVAEAAESGKKPARVRVKESLPSGDGKEARGRRLSRGKGRSRAGSRSSLVESSTLEPGAASDAASERGAGAEEKPPESHPI